MTIWFTSDTHFNHANVVARRPFSSLEEMTEVLIDRWNFCVEPGDTIYHLGDFALSWGKKHAELIDDILARLNGQKVLIKGNHDRDEVVKNPRWHSVYVRHEIKVDLGGIHKQHIVMDHYSLRTWNRMHYGAWMIHGHSHGNLSDIGGKTLDVGVDVLNFYPISLEHLKGTMDLREFVSVDHHGKPE